MSGHLQTFLCGHSRVRQCLEKFVTSSSTQDRVSAWAPKLTLDTHPTRHTISDDQLSSPWVHLDQKEIAHIYFLLVNKSLNVFVPCRVKKPEAWLWSCIGTLAPWDSISSVAGRAWYVSCSMGFLLSLIKLEEGSWLRGEGRNVTYLIAVCVISLWLM